MYIYEHKNWPHFRWNEPKVANRLAEIKYRLGHLEGLMQALGFPVQLERQAEALTEEIVKSHEIEGVRLNNAEVRSSVASRLGLPYGGEPPGSKYVEGIVDMMLDALHQASKPLTQERLFNWHKALFPPGRTEIYPITPGAWRTGRRGPMRVVSGPVGKEKVHFEAPPAAIVDKEMEVFLDWMNNSVQQDNILKAAIAHLWFVTVHPFEDGNGRIARAISEMLLAREEGGRKPYYSMSAQIQRDRKNYYRILEQTQKGDLDITGWMLWFLDSLEKAILHSEEAVRKAIKKYRFWQTYGGLIKNKRQQKILNMLLDGFEGKLTATKWAKITKTSPDTALRDIQDLMKKGILQKSASGGRSMHYFLVNKSY